MARTIHKVVRKRKLTSKEGKEYTLYTYMLDDGSEVDAMRPYYVGEKVEVWFDHKWNKAKLKKKNESL